ncbi:hypothetical protein [Yellowstone lake phycodnavirus 3]|uniref:hypothetical protein n=1 Tax=Yellowstone lake phycodnavirus 3 TaxID=1586715 RepID=UPI0006EBCF56|nr:hypothetical protein AR677_gp128 [Yellowstone lake phycodnavirus 3]BAT22627.1 hypothetical protein [Yellowstone lake phycodnavirus 3]
MDRKGLAIMILAGVILLLLFAPKRSGFAGGQAGMSGANLYKTGIDATYKLAHPEYAPTGGAGSSADVVSSASLIPRDVIQTEDFGQFSPDKILGNQNYLDPRSQIGYPETVGGVLRNANRQFRSEPTNPRSPVSIFNLSTIPPDTMRPKFEISPEYQ